MKDGSHNKNVKKKKELKDLTFMDANVSVMAFYIHLLSHSVGNNCKGEEYENLHFMVEGT